MPLMKLPFPLPDSLRPCDRPQWITIFLFLFSSHKEPLPHFCQFVSIFIHRCLCLLSKRDQPQKVPHKEWSHNVRLYTVGDSKLLIFSTFKCLLFTTSIESLRTAFIKFWNVAGSFWILIGGLSMASPKTAFIKFRNVTGSFESPIGTTKTSK